MMEPYAPFWFEEPVSVRDLGGFSEAKRGIALPVVTGEELYTKVEFHEVIARRAAERIFLGAQRLKAKRGLDVSTHRYSIVG